MRNRNKYNPRLAVHPLGHNTHPRIDVLHGDQDIRIEAGYCEAIEIARQQLATLDPGFGVLFINLTNSQKQVERDHEYACNSRREDSGMFKHVTYRAGEFASKLGIMTQAVVQKRLATILVCEFAFQSSRHKKLVVDWLKDLKDHFGRQVVVVSLHHPNNFGLDKTLVRLSESISRIGDYSLGDEIEILPDTVTGVVVEEASPNVHRPGVPKLEGDVADADVLEKEVEAEHPDLVQDETLKNKELDPVDL